ncbi:MAG TPA: hypothetical protein PKC87_03035 [Candidatus Absconditabacterales bacterium]|nr:hypothetical protein [Candidatus Absconditabacterales bacterium]
MAKRFHHHITGDFHIKNGRVYKMVRVFRPQNSSSDQHKNEERTTITRLFLGKHFDSFICYLPTKWQEGVSYELQRVHYESGTHIPKEG